MVLVGFQRDHRWSPKVYTGIAVTGMHVPKPVELQYFWDFPFRNLINCIGFLAGIVIHVQTRVELQHFWDLAFRNFRICSSTVRYELRVLVGFLRDHRGWSKVYTALASQNPPSKKARNYNGFRPEEASDVT